MVKGITAKRLENIALFYLERYDTSAFKLKSVLDRRVLRARISGIEIDENVNQWIDDIVKKMVHLGYVDDLRYAQNQWRILQNKGKSTRYIAQKLKQDGIDDDILENLQQSDDPSCKTDLETAKRLVEKKKIGHFRPKSEQADHFKKDLGTLARAGFSYEIACQALKEDD